VVFEAWRRIDYSSGSDLDDRLSRISRVYSKEEIEYVPSVDEYYNDSCWAYRFFYNNSGYIHLGVSDWEGYRSGPEAILDYISSYIERNGVRSVLELGYGVGSDLAFLSKRHPDVRFVGVDRVNRPLKRNAVIRNVHYIRGDFEDVGRFFSTGFDLVIAIEAVCYSPDLTVVDAVADVLSPDGSFIVFDIYNNTERSLTNEERRARVACARSVGIDSFIDHTRAIEQFSRHFNITASADLSGNVLDSLERMENIAAFFFRHPYLARIFNRFNPPAFTRNSILGLLLPACLRNGALVYYMDTLRRS